MTARFVSICIVLLLLASVAYGGVYQRTRDGKTLVWNNIPRPRDQVSWSGDRDAQGYATGPGTLTWYTTRSTVETGSNIPSNRRNVEFSSRYSGNMVQGKLHGRVVSVDASGKIFHGRFSKGQKTSDWTEGPPPSSSQRLTDNTAVSKEPNPPAAGPAPAAVQQSEGDNSVVAVGRPVGLPVVSVEPETHSTPVPISSVAEPAPPVLAWRGPESSTPQPTPVAPETAQRIGDFKRQTQSTLDGVGKATADFHEVDRLDLVKPLPGSVSQSVSKLVDQAGELRSELGQRSIAQEYHTEEATVDAMVTVDQVTNDIGKSNVAGARSKLTAFLSANPEPADDSQQHLWRYLVSMRSLCDRLDKEAGVHLRRAQSLASAGRSIEAIREYEEANRIFPNPVTAEKIRQLKDNSLGL